MKSSKNKIFWHAIVIWPDDLKYFDTFLHKYFSEVKYRVTCKDDTQLSPDNLEILLGYENPNFRRIKSMTITGSNGGINGDKVEININDPDSFLNGTIEINLQFSDFNNQYIIEDEILKRIKTLKPWYSLLSRIPFTLFLMVMPFGLFFISTSVSLFKKLFGFLPPGNYESGNSSITESEATIFLLFFIGFLALIGYALDISKNYLFPKVFFCIGRQEKAYHKRQKILYWIFGIIVLGIIINIVATIIYQQIQK